MSSPSTRGLDEYQAALVRAWCALYVVNRRTIDEPECIGFVGAMGLLRERLTDQSATRCAQWERRYWQARAAQYPEVADDND